MTKAAGQLWAMVLAGGEGRRLQPLTTALYGEPMPKQYAALVGPRSLLQSTLDRVGALVPPERTVLVVGRGHERWALPQTAEWPSMTILVEPMKRGTGPGVLLPLSHIIARDPDARVVVFPTDHHVTRPDRFIGAVRSAVTLRDTIALLGITADYPDTEYGWIVAGSLVGSGTARHVRRFFEKPSPESAEALMGLGAFWNTFVFTGPARAIWRATRRTLPAQTAIFETYSEAIGTSFESVAREIAYVWVEPASFSRVVLAHTPGLVVIPADGCGWSDLGTPQRVFAALRGRAPSHGPIQPSSLT